MQQASHSRSTRHSAGLVGLFVLLMTLIVVAIAPGVLIAQTEDSIVGEFGVTLIRSDVPTDLPDGYNYVGDWIIRINEDGTYTATRQDVGLLVSGTWEVSGERVTFTDETGFISCSNPTAVTIPGDDVTSGSYEWTRTVLNFSSCRSKKSVEGDCSSSPREHWGHMCRVLHSLSKSMFQQTTRTAWSLSHHLRPRSKSC